MKNFGKEVAFWRFLWKLTINDKLTPEDSSSKWRIKWSDNIGLDVGEIALFILVEYNAIRGIFGQFCLLLGQGIDNLGIYLLR